MRTASNKIPNEVLQIKLLVCALNKKKKKKKKKTQDHVLQIKYPHEVLQIQDPCEVLQIENSYEELK